CQPAQITGIDDTGKRYHTRHIFTSTYGNFGLFKASTPQREAFFKTISLQRYSQWAAVSPPI
ncbi:MAG: hypothetical protein K6C08_11030, partial [Oscillospiraceae bacterium]|nr:hypothetical protein [Oscillospiraceae bacterium]